MSAWPFLPFDEAVEDASGGNVKTKQNDYAEQGSFAIVDQGKALISGYTDDPAALCKAELPVVVFGDHTRCLKYVDFPFGMGADGVKVLRPRVDLDVKFLYHYLRQLRLPDGGYDRHFKYLKRETIPVPLLEEQRRIAAILDQAETLRTQRRQALAQLDSLTQSLFLDMFGDPVSNPKRLPLLRGDQVCSRITVGIVVQPASYYRDSGVPALRSLNIRPNKVVMENLVYFSPEDNEKKLAKTRVRKGDVVLVRTGQPGTAAVVPAELDGVNAIDILIATPDASKILADYLCFFYNSDAGKQMVLGAQRGQVQKHLNVGSMNAALIPVPPLALQQTFATRIQAIEALKATHRAALAQLDALFASLQQRAFAGELTAQASTTVAVPQAKRSFAELGQLDAAKGVESLVYAAKRLPGKGHYWPTKVQYFADKRHLERYGRSIYGETYVAMERGPVPQAAYNASRALAEGALICEFPLDVVRAALRRDGNQLIALRDADTNALSAQERECLDWAIRYVKDLSFDQLQTASHDAAWHKTAANMPMAWEDIAATLPEAAQQRFFM